MIPFSSQVSKFKGIYNKKMQKYHRCDTIVFEKYLVMRRLFDSKYVSDYRKIYEK